MSELIPINIVIADRSYRIRIEPAEEEMVRKSASLINDKIAEYRQNLAGKDMQDYVAMVLLWFATEQNTSNRRLHARRIFGHRQCNLNKACIRY